MWTCPWISTQKGNIMYNSPNVIYWKYMYNTCTTVYTCKTGRDFIRLLRASFHKSSVINSWASKMWQMISVPVWLTYKTETCLLSRGRFFFLDYIDGYPHIQLNGIWVYILNQMYTFPNQTWFSWLKKKQSIYMFDHVYSMSMKFAWEEFSWCFHLCAWV